MTKVAIEAGLRPFQDALRTAGFIVVRRTPEEVVTEVRRSLGPRE